MKAANQGAEKHAQVDSLEKRGLPEGVHRERGGLRAQIGAAGKIIKPSGRLADTPGNAAHLGQLCRQAREQRDKELLQMATPTPKKNTIAKPPKKQCTIAGLLRRR